MASIRLFLTTTRPRAGKRKKSGKPFWNGSLSSAVGRLLFRDDGRTFGPWRPRRSGGDDFLDLVGQKDAHSDQRGVVHPDRLVLDLHERLADGTRGGQEGVEVPVEPGRDAVAAVEEGAHPVDRVQDDDGEDGKSDAPEHIWETRRDKISVNTLHHVLLYLFILFSFFTGSVVIV